MNITPINFVDPLGLLREPVELRRFAELGGADVTWNQEAQSITVTVPGRTPVVFYTLQTGSPVWFEDGTAMIEASFLRNALGSSMPSRLMYRFDVSRAVINDMEANMTVSHMNFTMSMFQIGLNNKDDALAMYYAFDNNNRNNIRSRLNEYGFNGGLIFSAYWMSRSTTLWCASDEWNRQREAEMSRTFKLFFPSVEPKTWPWLDNVKWTLEHLNSL